jgi:hypothetical protein
MKSMTQEIRQRVLGLDALGPMSQWSPNGTGHLAGSVRESTQPGRARVELVGLHLRVAGAVDTGEFSRLSDIVNCANRWN